MYSMAMARIEYCDEEEVEEEEGRGLQTFKPCSWLNISFFHETEKNGSIMNHKEKSR